MHRVEIRERFINEASIGSGKTEPTIFTEEAVQQYSKHQN